MSVVSDWDGKSVPDLLEMERLDRDLFRNRLNQRNANDALFGGQVLAQSLTAASHTIGADGAPRHVHSLHGYFLRAGKHHAPVIYQVDRTRDGGRFSTRRVIALQDGEPIFHMECGFHAPENGYDHQVEMPANVPGHSELPSIFELARDEILPEALGSRWLQELWPIEVKPTDAASFLHTEGLTRRSVWMRLPSGAGASPAGQACLLAYMSDFWLAGTAAIPHTLPAPHPGLFLASLDHAMWFHRPVQVDQWLLFDLESPSAQDGRGFSRGSIFTESGVLVASVAQEALLRPRKG